MTNNELAHRLQAAYIDALARNFEAAGAYAEVVDDTTAELLAEPTGFISYEIALQEMAHAAISALAKIA